MADFSDKLRRKIKQLKQRARQQENFLNFASEDTHNPLYDVSEESLRVAACYNMGLLPLKPVCGSLMFEPGWLKDRENRATYPKHYKRSGHWTLIALGASSYSPAEWATWEKFLGRPLPYLPSHPFPKNHIIGMALMKEPLPDDADTSLWVDRTWGNSAWVIAKLLKFHAPVKGFDNMMNGYGTCILGKCRQREHVAAHISRRLKQGDYDWVWVHCDDVGDPIYIPPRPRR